MRTTSTEPTRRLTLSLRVFLVLVLVVGGWLGWRIRRASLQRRAVAAIREAGGLVWYDYQRVRLPNGQDKFLPKAQPWTPGWLRRSIGDEYFQDVIRVALLNLNDRNQGKPISTEELLGVLDGLDRLEFLWLVETTITDDGLERIGRAAGLADLAIELSPLQNNKLTAAGLAHLGALTELRKLSISGLSTLEDAPITWTFLARLSHLESLSIVESNVDGAVLSQLQGLTRLRSVMLHDTDPGDADLAHLAGLSQLESVAFEGQGITDDGLAHMAGLTSLRNLDLPGANQVTDDGLAHLRGLTRLRSLNLKRSQVTDAGLAHLAGLGELEYLSVGTTWGESEYGKNTITDAGLAHLAGLKSLRELHLPGANQFSDAGLAHLQGLTNLRTLDIASTKATDAGLVHLAGLTELSELNLGTAAPGTGAGLTHLASLRKLKFLNLSVTGVTDAGLHHLANLTCLLSVQLNGPGVTDAGLGMLSRTSSTDFESSTVVFSRASASRTI